jgi:hypothetical protein
LKFSESDFSFALKTQLGEKTGDLLKVVVHKQVLYLRRNISSSPLGKKLLSQFYANAIHPTFEAH